MLFAECGNLGQVAVVRDEDTKSIQRKSSQLLRRVSEPRQHVRSDSPGLSLDRLNEEGGDLLSVLLERGLDGSDVVVGDLGLGSRADGPDSLEERSEADAGLGVGRHGHDTERSAVEVAGGEEIQTEVSDGPDQRREEMAGEEGD